MSIQRSASNDSLSSLASTDTAWSGSTQASVSTQATSLFENERRRPQGPRPAPWVQAGPHQGAPQARPLPPTPQDLQQGRMAGTPLAPPPRAPRPLPPTPADLAQGRSVGTPQNPAG